MNLYVIIAAASVVAIAGAGVQGYRMGRDAEIAARVKEEQLVADVRAAAMDGAAAAIAKIKIVNQTIRSKVEVQTRDVPVYRDCVNTPDAVQLLDAARSGSAPAESARDRIVPGARADQPPDVR